jgi:ABC-2 type transport system ATP-binding protein
LIVLDEPTNALDPSGVILLREALLRRAADGAAVFVSSHHLDELARIADRITVLNAGVVIGSLDPAGVDIERSFFELVHDHDRQFA